MVYLIVYWGSLNMLALPVKLYMVKILYCHLLILISTLLDISVIDVSSSQDYIKNCPMQLLPPYVIQKFDSVALGFLRTSYQSFFTRS